jgi:fermentation-respiration switch protein FrsA (DUF1100 family)
MESMSRRTVIRQLAPVLLLAAGLFAPAAAEGALEQRYIYFPDRELIATPAAIGLAYEEVGFAAADGTALHGWYLPGEAGRPLVVFCHGNAGNISHRLESLHLLHGLGLSVFIFDYRGYGQSAGTPSEEGTYADARGALAWLRQRGWTPAQLIYFGESLGAAVALQLAVEQPPAGLVLEAPFTSIAAMGRHHYLLLHLLLGWLLDARYDNLAKIGRVHSPLLIIQGKADTIVPPAMSRRLYEAANEPKNLRLIPRAGHNDLLFVGGNAWRDAWREFIGRFPRLPEGEAEAGDRQ